MHRRSDAEPFVRPGGPLAGRWFRCCSGTPVRPIGAALNAAGTHLVVAGHARCPREVFAAAIEPPKALPAAPATQLPAVLLPLPRTGSPVNLIALAFSP